MLKILLSVLFPNAKLLQKTLLSSLNFENIISNTFLLGSNECIIGSLKIFLNFIIDCPELPPTSNIIGLILLIFFDNSFFKKYI